MVGLRSNINMSVSPKRQKSLRKQSGSRLPSPGERVLETDLEKSPRVRIAKNEADAVDVTFSGSGTFQRDTDVG